MARSGLPAPPADFSSRALPLSRIGGSLYRIHRSIHSCLYFGKNAEQRFDDPQRLYGVLYTGANVEAAFAEVFLRTLSEMVIPEGEFAARSLSVIRCSPLACVDLTTEGLRKLSCDNRITTETPYGTVGLWSRAIYDHPDHPDGIVYRSRHNPGFPCVALFDRCEANLTVKSTESLLRGATLTWTVDQIDKCGLELDPFP